MEGLEERRHRLIARREALGWKPGQLALAAQVFADRAGHPVAFSQQLIWNFESGKAKKLPAWLRFAEQALNAAESDDPDAGLQDNPDSRRADVVLVREIDITYAMGEGAVIEDYPSFGEVPFDAGFLRGLTRAPLDKLIVARGEGDSMTPTLINDDMVLIDMSQRRIAMQDRIWALALRGAGMIKRVRVRPKEGFTIISDNAVVPPQDVDEGDLFIVGRVIWAGRRL